MKALARIIGPAATVKLVDHYGGTESNYIPMVARVDHPFVQIIGFDRFKKLCDQLGGKTIEIPNGSFRDSMKAKIHDASGTARHVALQAGCTERYVRKVRNMVRDTRQGNLLDD